MSRPPATARSVSRTTCVSGSRTTSDRSKKVSAAWPPDAVRIVSPCSTRSLVDAATKPADPCRTSTVPWKIVRFARAATTVVWFKRTPVPVAIRRSAAASAATSASRRRVRFSGSGGTATSGTRAGACAWWIASRTSVSVAVTTVRPISPSMSLASRSAASSSGSAIARVALVRPNSTSATARSSQKRRGS